MFTSKPVFLVILISGNMDDRRELVNVLKIFLIF